MVFSQLQQTLRQFFSPYGTPQEQLGKESMGCLLNQDKNRNSNVGIYVEQPSSRWKSAETSYKEFARQMFGAHQVKSSSQWKDRDVSKRIRGQWLEQSWKIFKPLRNPKGRFLKYAHDTVGLCLHSGCKQCGDAVTSVFLSETASCNSLPIPVSPSLYFFSVEHAYSHKNKWRNCDY